MCAVALEEQGGSLHRNDGNVAAGTNRLGHVGESKSRPSSRGSITNDGIHRVGDVETSGRVVSWLHASVLLDKDLTWTEKEFIQRKYIKQPPRSV